MREPVQVPLAAIAGCRSEYQGEPGWFPALEEALLEGDQQLVWRADADEAGNGNSIAAANDRYGFGWRDDLILHGAISCRTTRPSCSRSKPSLICSSAMRPLI